jgi:hypothetical protein
MKSSDLPIFTECERNRAHDQRYDAARNRQHSPGKGEDYDLYAAGKLIVEEVGIDDDTDDERGNAGILAAGSSLDRVRDRRLVPGGRGLILAKRLFVA